MKRLTLASSARWRYTVAPAMAQGVFQGAFLSRQQHGRAGVVHQQPELLPGGAVLQRLPAAAARGRRAADAALHRRTAGRRLLGADLPGGPADARPARSIAFRPGIGMIASRLGVPVVPVRLDGLDDVLHHQLAHGAPRPRPRRLRRAAAPGRRRLRSAGEAGRRRGPSALNSANSSLHQFDQITKLTN